MNAMTHIPRAQMVSRFHRLAALVVLGLQLALTGSAIWEARPGVKLGAHAEQGGARHADQHDEESCVVCAVRAQASAPTPTAQMVSADAAATMPPARDAEIVLDRREVATLSRAPPIV